MSSSLQPATLLLSMLLPAAVLAQTTTTPTAKPVSAKARSSSSRTFTSAPNPTASTSSPSALGGSSVLNTKSSATATFHDSAYKISFDYPSNWNFSRKDHEISTFHLDARSAPPNSNLRAVTAIPENPYPSSTFSGAYVYLSVTPHATDASCAKQAAPVKPAVSQIAGIPFVHGYDEQKHICTVARDEIYTTYHQGACYRFDLAINNFCGGEVSGVKDVTKEELENVRTRLQSILSTVRFDSK